MIKSLTLFSESDKETTTFGEKFGNHLEEGDTVALVGALGSGKTWLTKGIARGLGVGSEHIVTSPSFALVNEYDGKCTFFHMDIYRLGSLTDFLSAGLEEYLHTDSVVVMEWADRWPEILPERHIRVELIILDENRRKISLSGRHPRARKIIENIKDEIGKSGFENYNIT